MIVPPGEESSGVPLFRIGVITPERSGTLLRVSTQRKFRYIIRNVKSSFAPVCANPHLGSPQLSAVGPHCVHVFDR